MVFDHLERHSVADEQIIESGIVNIASMEEHRSFIGGTQDTVSQSTNDPHNLSARRLARRIRLAREPLRHLHEQQHSSCHGLSAWLIEAGGAARIDTIVPNLRLNIDNRRVIRGQAALLSLAGMWTSAQQRSKTRFVCRIQGAGRGNIDETARATIANVNS